MPAFATFTFVVVCGKASLQKSAQKSMKGYLRVDESLLLQQVLCASLLQLCVKPLQFQYFNVTGLLQKFFPVGRWA